MGSLLGTAMYRNGWDGASQGKRQKISRGDGVIVEDSEGEGEGESEETNKGGKTREACRRAKFAVGARQGAAVSQVLCGMVCVCVYCSRNSLATAIPLYLRHAHARDTRWHTITRPSLLTPPSPTPTATWATRTKIWAGCRRPSNATGAENGDPERESSFNAFIMRHSCWGLVSKVCF